jgi:hypothetical protein
MLWTHEPGFEHFNSCWNFVHQHIAQANIELTALQRRLELVIVDTFLPDLYRQGQQVLVTSCWVEPEQMDPARHEQFPAASWYGIYHGTPHVEPAIPIKKFNCFINRMDPVRQSWLYQLIRRDVFDQGLISFNMEIRRRPINGRPQLTDPPHAIFEQQFQQHLQIFQPEHELIRKHVPYRNFDGDLNKAIMQTEFSIVLETYFECNSMITFSEKIFRCLKLPRPWVMFAMKNAVAYLRDLGFDVLDDLVDHNYDLVDFAIARQVAVLNQIEIMCRQTLTESQIHRCQQAANHNQQLLIKMYSNFYTDVNTACKNAITKCIQL